MNKELQNLAWSILPKEFKEEVKEHYAELNTAYIAMFDKDGLTNAECDRCQAIREKKHIYNMYFGHHNLTSDAEGEEVLMCEKSKVMKLYNKFQKDGTFTCLYAAGVLDTLFGSKCLSDEKDCATCQDKACKNYDTDNKHCRFIEDCKFEPKPAEPLSQNPPENCNNESHIADSDNKPTGLRFKVGDKVIFHPFKSDSFIDAEVVEAKEGEDYSYLLGYGDGEMIWVHSSEVQSIAETYPGSPAKPKFKVGDYVRYKGDVHKVVATTKDDRCYLNKILGSVSGCDLEPYTEQTCTQTCTDDCPSHHIADADKMVDSITKDGFKNHNRLHIATQITAAIYANPDAAKGFKTIEAVVRKALDIADTLIKEAGEGGDQ